MFLIQHVQIFFSRQQPIQIKLFSPNCLSSLHLRDDHDLGHTWMHDVHHPITVSRFTTTYKYIRCVLHVALIGRKDIVFTQKFVLNVTFLKVYFYLTVVCYLEVFEDQFK